MAAPSSWSSDRFYQQNHSVTGPNNFQQHSAPSQSEGIVNGPRRKQNESTKSKVTFKFICLFKGHDCGFMQNNNNKVFKNCAELKEDLIRHLNLFQCERCLRRFGKKYGLDRHLEKTKRCRRKPETENRVPITPISKEMLKKIQDARKYEKIAEAAAECIRIHPDSLQHYAEQVKAAFNERMNRTSSSPPNTPQHHQPDSPLEYPAPVLSPVDRVSYIQAEFEYQQESSMSADGVYCYPHQPRNGLSSP